MFAGVEFLGHATGEKTAMIIMEDGLRIDKSGITATCIYLEFGLEQSIEIIDRKTLHRDYKNCVLVKLPAEFKICGKNEILRYVAFCDEDYSFGERRFKLRPEFILGVYNKDSKKLIKNPKFYDNLPEEEKQKCEDKLKQNFCNALNSEDFGGIKRYLESIEELEDWEKLFPLTEGEVEKYDRSNLFTENKTNVYFDGQPYKKRDLDKDK